MYTCKIKWDCGTVVCYKSYEISQSTTVPQSHSTAVPQYHSPTVPLEFTCISIQVVLWYCGTLQKTHPKSLRLVSALQMHVNIR